MLALDVADADVNARHAHTLSAYTRQFLHETCDLQEYAVLWRQSVALSHALWLFKKHVVVSKARPFLRTLHEAGTTILC